MISPPSEIYFHLLASVLIVAAPVTGSYMAARIKAAPCSAMRLRGYWLAVAFLVLGSLAVFLLVPPASLFDIQMQNRGAAWLPSRELIGALAVILVLLTALPVLLARRSGAFQVALRKQIHGLHDLLPQTRQERLWFLFAGICAGVCEEVLYRGFLLHYLHVFPWKIDIATSLVLACAVFGSVHLYQGIGRVLQSVLLALGLAVLFLCTRSLLLPIVLHVLVDLRILVVLPDFAPAADETD